MIIVKLQGGVGNQMFQYAAGKQLAHIHQTTLKLDINSFERDPLREYALQFFNIDAEIAVNNEIDELTFGHQIHDRYRKRILWYLPFLFPHHFRERENEFNEKFFRLNDDIYLEGYFQSEKYFKKIENKIRNDFKLKVSLSTNQLEIKSFMCCNNSVSIHVRRGDYVNDSKITKIHYVCDLDYYKRCVEYLIEKVSDPYFFVFSDDLQWVKDNLKISAPIFFINSQINKQAIQDVNDLMLMSSCKHHIISNSSFSWWGSWLSNYEKRIIVAPSLWNRNSKKKNMIFLDHWILVKCG
jgi:hypothetical protein